MVADVISLDERRRTRVPASQDVLDEATIELAVRRAESAMFARRCQSHARAALHALATAGVSVPMAEHHVSNLLRLAVQEIVRATAEDPEPVAAEMAA